MTDFTVWEPATPEQALALLGAWKGQARPLAGGTDLLVQMKQGKVRYSHLVSLQGWAGWDEITVGPDGFRMGALARISDLEYHAGLKEHFPFLAGAAGELGSRQVRNLATLGGNLCNAAPSAETAPSLLTLDAVVTVVGPAGEREVPLEAFFTGPGGTVLGADELVRGVYARAPRAPWYGVYYKLSPRRAMDIAVVNVAVVLVLDTGKEKVEEARIALGAVAPTPLRVRGAEDMLAGKAVTADLVERVASACVAAARPITDVRAPAEYRRAMVRELVGRGLRECWRALREEGGDGA
ncbi:MAG TPA: xanthine dehydrogenase family protein subunit M [Firmicutes bacterium]|nr:xanthine dehydrogenase family protein subunit M [Bacillota bacterium]